jgi:hypothetical protein
MPDMDWDRILSTLRKGREQLDSLRIGSDKGEKQADKAETDTTGTQDNPQDHDS